MGLNTTRVNSQNFDNTRNYLDYVKTLIPYLVGDDFSIKLKWVIAFFSIVASIFLGLGVPLILKELINILSNAEVKNYQIMFFLVLIYGTGWFLNQSMINLRGILMWPIGERAVKNLCLDILSHLLRLSTDFHLNRKTGTITSAIEKVQHNLIDSFLGLLFLVLPTTIELFLATFILWKLCGFWYGFILLTMFIVFIIISFKGNQWSLVARAESNKEHAQSSSTILDILLNNTTVKYFNNEEYEYNRCNKILSTREKLISKAFVHSELARVLQLFTIGTGLTILMFLAGYEGLHGNIDVSDFILINTYILQFITPLSFFGLIFRNSWQAFVNVESALSLLEINDIMHDDPKAISLHKGPREITFENVSFSYSTQRPILRNVTFTLLAKERTAIVGLSGSGKSTIASLLFRLYDPANGKILIDSQDVKYLKRKEIQKIIGVIPQDIVLFNTTLYENILYGNPSTSKSEVDRVCEICHLTSLIKQLPSGLETVVGERGLKISGGEKQRIGIARALLKKPEIFILDEATSSLDSKTEKLILQDIEAATKGVTTLIIAHRLQSIVNCKRIIVLEAGRIAEQGNHEELIEKKGIYATMWEKQKSKK